VTAGRGPGLRRDAVTRAGYSVLGGWAWFLYGFGALLPLLRAEQGTSRTVMGLHSLALSGGALVAGLTTVAVVSRVHRRGAFLLGAALAAAGVTGLAAGSGPPWTLAATLVAGTGGSTMLNAALPALTDHHGTGGAAALSEANAVAAGIGLLAPLAVGASVALGWSWRPAALAVLPLLVVVLAAVRRVPAGTPAVDAAPPRPTTSRRRRLSPSFHAYLVAVVTCIAVEFCCTAWSADLLRQRTTLSAAAASAGVTAVVGGMFVGRVALGRLALARPPARLFAYALALTVAGWVVLWFATKPVIALAGLALTGLGIAGHYPLGAALLMSAVPGQADQASSRLSLGIAVASGGGPLALGAVADASGTHTAFVAVPLLIGLASAALLVATVLARRAPARPPHR
jgi:fucose permease